MPRKAINSPLLSAVGPYSHAVDCDGLVFLSGQTPVDPQTGKLVDGDVAEQTKQCFKNLFSVLESAGLSTDEVQKVNVFLTSMGDFACMNEVYKQQFKEPYPARSTIAVAGLPLNAKIDIELIAKRNS